MMRHSLDSLKVYWMPVPCVLFSLFSMAFYLSYQFTLQALNNMHSKGSILHLLQPCKLHFTHCTLYLGWCSRCSVHQPGIRLCQGFRGCLWIISSPDQPRLWIISRPDQPRWGSGLLQLQSSQLGLVVVKFFCECLSIYFVRFLETQRKIQFPLQISFLDAIASPSTYPCGSVSGSIVSGRFIVSDLEIAIASRALQTCF